MDLTDSEEINALLSYNPPSLEVPPTSVDEDSPAPALSFYDMHLSSNLSLQRVVYLPTLLKDMATVVDTCLGLADAQDLSLPAIATGDCFCTAGQRKKFRVDTKSTDVMSIAMLYEETTAANCEAVASTVFLTPQCSSWMPAVTFGRTYKKDNTADQTFTLEEYSLSLLGNDEDIYFYPAVKECLSHEKKQLLRSLWKRDPRLATWEFLPYTSQAITVIQNLCHGQPEHMKIENIFHMRTYPPIGVVQETTATVSFDAEDTPWRLHDLSPNIRPRKPTSSANTERYPSVKVHVAAPPSDSRTSIVDQVLQHAWVTACRRDSTFIVFQCGNYERIGIRHRASQTLYLSDVIDVPNSTDPGSYTKLHLSLYISILQDVMQRAVHIPQGDAPPLPQKRRQLDDEPLTRPRQRLRSEYANHLSDGKINNKTTADFSGNICSRNLLLVSLQYSVYFSPNPTTFFRCSHRPTPAGSKRASYKATEYIHIRLDSLITQGATGLVHEGTLEAYREDQEHITCRIVAKLNFGDAQKERTKHEAAVYEHLTKAGVCGIPKYYGIFEDLHSGHLILVTSHEGFPLRHWIPDFKDSETVVPEAWRNDFLGVLEAVHQAGVCHKDLRAENLLVNADDEVCIIDFAHACLTPSVEACQSEYDHLTHVLSGRAILSPLEATGSGSGLSTSPVSESDV